MHFVHRPYQPNDTIAAVATPPGEGGIAVIRISGAEAIDVADKVFSRKVHSLKSHTAYFGKIVDKQGHPIDEVLLLVMRAPRSYTGEDTVEIHCHGGALITRNVLETVLSAGARPALPGEFTFKAFISGKIDLAQAEAVQELISARNQLALDAAEQQLRGALSRHIQQFQAQLSDIAAILEAWVDFPEEGLEFASFEEIIGRLEDAYQHIDNLLTSFHDGHRIKEGFTLCLAGAPNVGKSSLMNALLGKERAIVTDIPGTTRDVLEEDLHFAGLHFHLIDTAGVRETEELVEKEGIKRTKDAMQRSDLLLLVLDSSRPITQDERTLIETAQPEKTILVWNKTDLPDTSPAMEQFPHSAKVSAKMGTGLKELRHSIEEVLWKSKPKTKEEIVITSIRHKQALEEALTNLKKTIDGLKNNVSAEFIAFDMRQALRSLGLIIGTDITEDILNAIFSKFCIGK